MIPQSRDKRSEAAEGCRKSRLSKTDPRTQSERWVVVAVVDVVVPVAVADEDYSDHDHGYDHDLLRLSRDYGD